MATKTQIGAVIGIEGGKEYLKAMRQLTQYTKEFESEMKALTSSFNENGKSIGDLKSEKQALQKIIDSENDKLAQQKKMMDNINQAASDVKVSDEKWAEAQRTVQTEINNTTTNINELQKRMDKLKEDNALTLFVDAWENASSKTGEALKTIGDGLTKYVTLPIAGAGAYSIKTAADFESSFTGVRKTVNGTEEELASLREELMKIPLETASTAETVMGVAEAAGQLNVPIDQIAEFTKYVIMLGDSTNITAEEGSTSIARFMNVMGVDLKKGVDDVNRFSSSLVALGNNTATDEESILALSLRLASAGKLAGMSIPEILGLSAAMSSVGLTAEAGGTAMSTTINMIAKDVAKGGENLEKFAKVAGMTSEEFAEKWRTNAVGALQDLLVGMSNLSEDGGAELLQFMDEVGWAGIRQSDTMRRLSSDYDGVNEAVKIANDNFATNEESLDGINALTEEASRRYEDFNSQLSQFKESVKQLAAVFGEELLPILKPIIDDATEMIKGFSEMDDRTKKNIMSFLGLAAVVGPVVGGIGSLMIWSAKLKSAFGVLKGAEGVGGLVSALGGASGGATAGGGLIGALEGVASTIADTAVPALTGAGTASLGAALTGAAVAYGTAYAAASAMDQKMYESAEACEYVASRYHWSEEKVNEFGYTWDENGHLVELASDNMAYTVMTNDDMIIEDVEALKNRWREKAREMAKNQTDAITEETPKTQSATYKMVKTGIEDPVTEAKDKMHGYGGEIASNLASGMEAKQSLVARAAGWLANTISSFLHFSEPDVGALSNFHTWMPDMMRGMAQGIMDNAYLVEDALTNVTNGMASQLNGGDSYNYGGVNIVLNVPAGANGQQIVDEIETELANRTLRRKAVFG